MLRQDCRAARLVLVRVVVVLGGGLLMLRPLGARAVEGAPLVGHGMVLLLMMALLMVLLVLGRRRWAPAAPRVRGRLLLGLGLLQLRLRRSGG